MPSAKGFTLLELMVVLVIMALVSAFVAPRLAGSLGRLGSANAAKKIAAALRYARSQAVSERETFVARFDFENREMDVRNPKSEIRNPKHDTRYRLPEGVRFSDAVPRDRMEAGIFEIIFYPAGNSSGGGLMVRDGENRKYEIHVDFITGAVRVSE